MFALKQYCNCLETNYFELLKGSRAQLKQTLTTIMVATCFLFVCLFFQLIPSKAVAEVRCCSCVSLFFNDADEDLGFDLRLACDLIPPLVKSTG